MGNVILSSITVTIERCNDLIEISINPVVEKNEQQTNIRDDAFELTKCGTYFNFDGNASYVPANELVELGTIYFNGNSTWYIEGDNDLNKDEQSIIAGYILDYEEPEIYMN